MLFGRQIFLGALLATPLLMTGAQAQEQSNVRMLMDWIIAVQHSPFLIADQKGYFEEEGITAKIDPGKGSGFAAINTANGVYDFGWGDLTTMLKFNVENPGSELVIVYQSVDATALAVVAAGDRGIETPADLNGKKINGTPGGVGFDTIGLLLDGAGVPDVKLEWVTASPELIPSMIVRGDMDGTTGYTFTQAPVLLDAGLKADDIKIIKYSDYNVDIYGPALFTTRAYAEANPETVKAVVKAVNRGTLDMLSNPQEAYDALQTFDPLMVPTTEEYRMGLLRQHMLTESVQEKGIGAVDDARMQHSVDLMREVFDWEPIAASEVYSNDFLPPVEERMVPKS
ncbi:ABC transporter substrate-binding protein [Aureimonas fodinaquatilis]|uniref:Thiamine pyrimidine synthase n=1 Tax=Aureimonas fodinaquatilis TaxID=2565783 RepID=A0A5B0DQE9_9HYPH|nr:ABC transporter substrate-binding protein [Aureimonas fodinaquatilis]KAA0969014.1 ABC transporter substrate-binding protein [Aureimonas fodinaquatilis]